MKTAILFRKLLLTVALLLPTLVLAEASWEFRLTPYIWFAGLKGDVATIPGSPEVPIDISSSDALKDTEASLMVLFDVKYGRHGFIADLLYSDVQSDEELIPSPVDLNMRSTSKTTMFTLAYQYELFNHQQTVIDLLAGARYWLIDSKLSFSGGLGFLAGKTISNDESWIDPVIGFKARAPLSNSQFYTAAGAGIGGFGIASEMFYEISANIGYQWSRTIGTAIGYRVFDVDYDESGFIYNVKQQGWQIGLTWAF